MAKKPRADANPPPDEDTVVIRLFLSDVTKLDIMKAARRYKTPAAAFRAVLTEHLDAALIAATGISPDGIPKARG